MSFDINWTLLQDGRQAAELVAYLNLKFESEVRPSFLGPVSVEHLDFGTVAPEIAVLDICDPLPEFYVQEFVSPTMSDQSDGSQDASSTDMQGSTLPHDPDNAQLEVDCKYTGDFSMAISTSLIVNQPTPAFMVLPVTLKVTQCRFSAVMIVAYMGRVVNICLKQPENGSYYNLKQ